MKTLYIDCQAGIAGDMTIAAFIDLGLPFEHLKSELAKLPLPKSCYDLKFETCYRKGIRGILFSVAVTEDKSHRHYSDIVKMIESSSLTDQVKTSAKQIFKKLAEAEAKVHGVELAKVHFHEVGGVDSIIDIVGTAISLDYFGIKEIYTSSLPLGGGFIDSKHGRLPVPAPATAELLQGLPIHHNCSTGERVTPTGAAIVASLAKPCRPEAMTVTTIGNGAGSKDYADTPNILRLIIGEQSNDGAEERIFVLETHIDDMNPELFGFLMERLFEAGALDVSFSQLQMKKNRPGIRLTVLATKEKLHELGQIILTESTAIGLRYYPVQRLVLERKSELRKSSLGAVNVKIVSRPEGTVRITPEFEDCRKIALEKGIPIIEVYRILESELPE
ncbi:MAG: nickel pincer cofactor biosynthesis protein LarC [Desulfuromonadales bacterium]|nr:nickel pincer cofactor biosynthesis protein LarC [Desulfuromonadales bacterium]